MKLHLWTVSSHMSPPVRCLSTPPEPQTVLSLSLLLSQASCTGAGLGLSESSVWWLTSLIGLCLLSSRRSVGGALSQGPSEDLGGDGSGEKRTHLPSSHLLL